MKLNETRRPRRARARRRMRIGRGIGSGKGKTGGRGGKGQTARSGVRIKGFEGGQMPLHRRLPKRGFNNTRSRMKLNEVNLGRVQEAIDAGKLDAERRRSTSAALVKAGVLRRAKDGVRLLGGGELKAKVAFSVCGRLEVGGRGGREGRRLGRRSWRRRRTKRAKHGGLTSRPCAGRLTPGVRRLLAVGKTWIGSDEPGHDAQRLAGTRSGTWPQQRNNWRPISISRRSPRPRSSRSASGSRSARCSSIGSAPTSRCPASIPHAWEQIFQHPGRRHPRHVQHVLRRRHPPHGDLRARTSCRTSRPRSSSS